MPWSRPFSQVRGELLSLLKYHIQKTAVEKGRIPRSFRQRVDALLACRSGGSRGSFHRSCLSAAEWSFPRRHRHRNCHLLRAIGTPAGDTVWAGASSQSQPPLLAESFPFLLSYCGEPPRVSRPWDESHGRRAAELAEARRGCAAEPGQSFGRRFSELRRGSTASVADFCRGPSSSRFVRGSRIEDECPRGGPEGPPPAAVAVGSRWSERRWYEDRRSGGPS